MQAWFKNRANIVLPVAVGILFLICWQEEGFHKLFGLALYQLPLPGDIVRSIFHNKVLLTQYTLYTGTEIAGGFVLGSLIGWLTAVMAVLFPRFGSGGIWLAASLNAVPIVALAPIMNNWFGDGISSRIGVVAVITMATMTINAYKGMSSLDPTYLELMRSYGAKRGQLFWKLRVKHSLPHLFSALKINMSTSIIGSLVGEFFISSKGIGYLLADQIKLANMPIAWACIVIASLIGISSYYFIQIVEKAMTPWHVSQRQQQ
ncbi:MAG: ABC transporter permease [Paenibacillus sp. RIFOXYA1_FULL_44_5]|nr:MAG: ABC transporter permease [Paenibacillus sp. RIFOXYA1_FULL_44_5]